MPHLFGPANQVTAARALLVGLLAAVALQPPQFQLALGATVTASVAAALDGLDGWIARRTRTATALGARFDMEVDALLILTLSVLVWRYGKAGGWVILAGLLRYGFVAAGLFVARMRRELPPSRRRQTICVVQIVGLIAALAPVIDWPLSAVAAAVTLAMLSGSFVVDIWWLYKHA